jgi:hypothetical protein
MRRDRRTAGTEQRTVRLLGKVCLRPSTPNSRPGSPIRAPVKPGNYATAVNIHNFHNGQTVTIAKKAVIANPENQPPGQISKFQRVTLGPDQALEVDCPDIASLLANPTTVLPPFIKGFVEIISPQTLSVTGVYTAQACDLTAAGQTCTQNGPVSIDVVPEQAFTGP